MGRFGRRWRRARAEQAAARAAPDWYQFAGWMFPGPPPLPPPWDAEDGIEPHRGPAVR